MRAQAHLSVHTAPELWRGDRKYSTSYTQASTCGKQDRRTFWNSVVCAKQIGFENFWMMILFVKSWTLNDEFCLWSPELWMMSFVCEVLMSYESLFLITGPVYEKDLWPKVFVFAEAQQMQRMRLSLDEELSRCLQYTVCNNCASCHRGRGVLTSRVGQNSKHWFTTSFLQPLP